MAEKVQDEAAKLGLEVVRFAGRDYGGAKLDDYHQAHAVGVMKLLGLLQQQARPATG